MEYNELFFVIFFSILLWKEIDFKIYDLGFLRLFFLFRGKKDKSYKE